MRIEINDEPENQQISYNKRLLTFHWFLFKEANLFISTFSLMCSIYRHVCSVFFLKYDIYKQPQAFVASEWSVLKSYMLKET